MRKNNLFLFLTALLAIAGIVLSVLSIHEYSIQYIANQIGVDIKSSFCDYNADFNCSEVNKSSWAQWFGVPVAAYGLFFYVSLLGLSFLFADRDRFYEDEAHDTISFLSFVSIIVSVGLFYISKFKVGVICPICLGVYIVNFVLVALAITSKPKQKSYLISVRDGLFTIIGLMLEALSINGRARAPILRLFALVLLVSAVAGFSLRDYFSLRYLASFSAQPDWESEPVKDVKIDSSKGSNEDYTQGPADAALKMVEFADYECPACQALFMALSELMSKYPGKVQYTFKNYPLDASCNPNLKQQMHQYACYSAYLSRCAGEQGKFWEMNEYLFKTGIESQELEGEALKSKLTEGVEKLGLKMETVESCLASEAVKNKILSDINDGDEAGLTGTPSLFINGKLVRDISYDNLVLIFDKILGPAK